MRLQDAAHVAAGKRRRDTRVLLWLSPVFALMGAGLRCSPATSPWG